MPLPATTADVGQTVLRLLPQHQQAVDREPKSTAHQAEKPVQFVADVARGAHVRGHGAALLTEQFGRAKAHGSRAPATWNSGPPI